MLAPCLMQNLVLQNKTIVFAKNKYLLTIIFTDITNALDRFENILVLIKFLKE